MRSVRNKGMAVSVLAAVLLLASCRGKSNGTAQAASQDNPAGSSAKAADLGPPTLTIPEGTPIVVRMLDSLSSAKNRGGDRFEATLADPLVVDGWVVAPRDSRVIGRVVAAEAGGHLQTPAELSITLSAIQIGGQTYDLRTSTISRSGRSHAKRNAEFIGGMAAGGALLGALVGHGKGAALGAGIGAGVGTGTAYATGKKDIYFPSETRLRFELKQALTVSRPA